MFTKTSVQLLACVALLGATSVHARDGSLNVAASWGDLSYSSDRNWAETGARRLLVSYDLGDAPIAFELTRLEADRSTYNFMAYCGCGVFGGIPPDNRELSAWQVAASYRFLTSRNGSALALRGGLYQAETRIFTGQLDEYSSRGLALGLAATWMVTPAVGVRAEYERLEGLEDIESYAASQVLTGVIVKFGGYAK